MRSRELPGLRSAARLGLLATIASLVALVVGVSGASAAPSFTQCPLENANVESCLYSQTTGGEFHLGNTTVPITKPIILQGGFYLANEEPPETTFVGAKNGETLSKTALNVPGGLAGLVNCKEIGNFILRASCELTFENGLTGVTATAELVGPAQFQFFKYINKKGPAITLPLRVKLSNPLLGSGCYIGGASDPLTLNLTTGTTSPPAPNGPITGSTGTVTFSQEGEAIEAAGNRLVDNAFRAPEAHGCGGLLSFVLDPILDLKEGLPSAAGRNTAIFSGSAFIAGRSIVK